MPESIVLTDPIYFVGDAVWMTEVECFALIRKVRRSICTFPRYDVVCDDGEELKYIVEFEMYPTLEQNFREAATVLSKGTIDAPKAERLPKADGLRLGGKTRGSGDPPEGGPSAA